MVNMKIKATVNPLTGIKEWTPIQPDKELSDEKKFVEATKMVSMTEQYE